MPKKGNDLLEYFSSPNSQLYYQGPSSSTHSEVRNYHLTWFLMQLGYATCQDFNLKLAKT